METIPGHSFGWVLGNLKFWVRCVIGHAVRIKFEASFAHSQLYMLLKECLFYYGLTNKRNSVESLGICRGGLLTDSGMN